MYYNLGKDASDVLRQAGKRGTDKKEEDLINLIPQRLWRKMLPSLEALTPYDGQCWTSD